MHAPARIALALALWAGCSCSEGLPGEDGSCKAEFPSELDVVSAEDADATDVSVSLMQQDLPRIRRTVLESGQPQPAFEHWVPTTFSTVDWPFQSVSCSRNQTTKTEHMTLTDYDQAVASVIELYSKLPDKCTATSCPQADWTGCILRLAAHDFMDFDGGSGLGGADGCLHLPDGDNAGLSNCLRGTDKVVGLLDAYAGFCERISLADFIVIGAEAVMNITRQNALIEDPTRKPLDFRSRFKYGRVTNAQCDPAKGKMPNAERGCNAVQDTLISNMGLTWNQSAALMGAHTIGEASDTRSGYSGRWVETESSRRFDNAYYLSIILKGWAPEPRVNGNPFKNQWKRVDIGVDDYVHGHEIMLDSDMCLYHSPLDEKMDPNPLHASTAKTQACSCAWVRPLDHLEAIAQNKNQFCGSTAMFPGLEPLGFGTTGHLGLPNGNTLNFTKQRLMCCGMQDDIIIAPVIDCGLPNAPKGEAAAAVALYARDEEAWLNDYYAAWDIATSNGYSSLSKLA